MLKTEPRFPQILIREVVITTEGESEMLDGHTFYVGRFWSRCKLKLVDVLGVEWLLVLNRAANRCDQRVGAHPVPITLK